MRTISLSTESFSDLPSQEEITETQASLNEEFDVEHQRTLGERVEKERQTVTSGVQVLTALEGYLGVLDKNPSAGDLRTIRISLEQHQMRLGMSQPVGVIQGASTDVLKRTIALAAQRQSANVRVAQEGLMATIKNTLVKLFTSWDDRQKGLIKVNRMVEHGQLNGKAFPEAAWSRIYSAVGKPNVSPGEVQQLLHNFHTNMGRKMVGLLGEATHVMTSAATALVAAAKSSEHQPLAMYDAMSARADELAHDWKMTFVNPVDAPKKKITLPALTQQQARALTATLGKMLGDQSLQKAVSAFDDAWNRYDELTDGEIDEMAEDGGSFHDARKDMNHMASTLQLFSYEGMYALQAEYALAYATYKYLQHAIG